MSVALITLLVVCVAAIGLWALAVWSAALGASAEAPASLPVSARTYAQAAPGADATHSPGAPLCGADLVVVTSPNAGTGSYLMQVVAISAGDVWAVGYYGNGSEVVTLTEHWNGSVWIIVYSPNVGTGSNVLNAVAAISSSNVWAVGYYASGTMNQTLVEHWDGTTWSVVNSANVGTFDELQGVAAVSSSDIWAAGWYLNGSTDQTLVEHWDGTTWSVVDSPNPGTNGNLLYAIATASAGNVWAVGFRLTATAAQTLVEHWDGTAWSVVNSPNAGTNNSYLRAVEVASASDVWAVGEYYVGSVTQTLAEHWDGSAWTIISSPNVGLDNNFLKGVVPISSSDVWAAGFYVNGGINQTMVQHWDGATWSVVTSPNVGTYDNKLFGIAAISSSDIWAAGWYLNGTTAQTLIERYNPCVPPTATPTSCPIQYSDVPAGSTFYTYIHCLACRGIVNGYPDGTFKPNNPVTRGQLSKIVSNSAGYSELHLDRTFQDVPINSTFYQFIERLASRGYINGYPCGGANEPCVPPTNEPYFRPNANVTRGQTSKIVASAKGLPSPPPGQQSFQDVSVSSTFWQWIEALATTGAINGYPCGNPEPCIPPGNLPYFRPNANVTRGQSTKIVGNTFFPNCQTPFANKR